MSTVLAVIDVSLGALACRTLISHVSSNWESENRRGNLAIRAFRAFCTAYKNVVASYSCGAITQRGGVEG